MIVYQSSKSEFSRDVYTNQIDEKIKELYRERLGRRAPPNEVQSWKNSLMYMNNLFYDSTIPDDANISIEFQIPLTSKRIDFIITGLGENQQENVVIVELKQWSSALSTNLDGIVKTRFQHGEKETPHPSYQAWSYASTIESFNQSVYEDNINLIPCAYLHNYKPDKVIKNPFYGEYLEKAPVFLKNDAEKLREFLERFIKYGDTKKILYRIENGKIKPSKLLADSLVSMLKGNREFVMIDDQKIVYEKALALSDNNQGKEVLIVEGGPGTGKSVVAVNLLVELTKHGKIAKYVSKNAAPRAVYASKLTGSFAKSHIHNLFSGSGSFIDLETDTFDVLIVDEAHRLNLKSGLYQNKGENQILELINASRFTVFFVDDDQQIHIKDIGEKSRIEQYAMEENANVTHLTLSSQFRCNGSDAYLAWLDNTLGKRETAHNTITQKEFDIRVFDDPTLLRDEIEHKNKINNKSRIVAGYCWDWKSKKDNKAYDIEIPEYDFKMKWNLTKDGSTWIIGEDSVNEIGCIHTCQGLELDYVGVVIGDDFVIRNGKVQTNVFARSYMDNSIRGIKKMMRENETEARYISDKIIKNTYRTLMTRGMKGCYIYCTDRETSEFFKSKIMKSNG